MFYFKSNVEWRSAFKIFQSRIPITTVPRDSLSEKFYLWEHVLQSEYIQYVKKIYYVKYMYVLVRECWFFYRVILFIKILVTQFTIYNFYLICFFFFFNLYEDFHLYLSLIKNSMSSDNLKRNVLNNYTMYSYLFINNGHS